ncbi:MAG: lysozyme [Bacteroidales bacterium]|jgi:lysozyme|nr:lysozyme [Bacteroidales bacterium]
MKISQKGIDFIKHFEGCKLEAYLDAGSVPTIGYGHTTVTTMGYKITQTQADQLLKEDLRITEILVNRLEINLNQNQFDAIISFVYNCGIGNFKKSRLLRLIKEYPDNSQIVNEFKKWRKGGGKVLPGLERRRMAEAVLYFTGKGVEDEV